MSLSNVRRKYKSLVLEGLDFDCRLSHLCPQTRVLDEHGKVMVSEKFKYVLKREMNLDEIEAKICHSWKTKQDVMQEQSEFMPIINKLKALINNKASLVLVFNDTTDVMNLPKYCHGRRNCHFHIIVEHNDDKKLSADPCYRALKRTCKNFKNPQHPKANINYQNVQVLAGLLFYLKYDQEKIFLGTNCNFILEFWQQMDEHIECDEATDGVGDIEIDEMTASDLEGLSRADRMKAFTGASNSTSKYMVRPEVDTGMTLGKVKITEPVQTHQAVMTEVMKEYPAAKDYPKL